MFIISMLNDNQKIDVYSTQKYVKDRINKKFVATYFLENCKYCMNVEVRKDKTTSTSYCSNIKKKKYRYSFKLQTIFYQMLWTKTFY